MDKEILTAILLKIAMMQKKSNARFSADTLLKYLREEIWRYQRPDSLLEAVNDILYVNEDAYIKYLSNLAIVEAKYKKISDFEDLMGGKQ